jgi:CO/xanthine dehydrogenase Mo-binding subunit
VTQRLRHVGRTHAISDAAQKVTGELVYGSDMELPGMLHAKLLLSPIAHGRVTRVDARRALALPGTIAVYSHLNAPSRRYCRARLMPGQELSPEDETLFSETVRFVGDRVAAVVATSLEAAAEALALIEVEYEALPALFTPQQALRETDVRIHPGGNLLFEHEVNVGSVPPDAAAAVTTTATTPRIHHAALEPHMCVAHCDHSGNLTIWGATQGVYGVRTVVADLLDLPYNRVRVVKVPMGGSFGGKTEFILEPLTAFLALRTRRPVKLVLTREECMIATMTRPATQSVIRTVVDRQGELCDVDITSTLDAGAYAASTADYATAMAAKMSRLYRMPHYHHRCEVVYTNTPVAGAARGWGAPEILTAVEIHMDQVARELRIDPVELRRRNLVAPFDVDPVGGLSLGDARVRQCLEEGAEAFGWRARRERPRRGGRFRRGVGVACGAHKNGMFGALPDASSMTLKMNEDGSFSLCASLHDTGCGVVTVMKVIIAEVLGVSPDLVGAGEADTAVTPYDYGTYGSRVTYVCGACARAAAAKLKGMILDAAADMLREPRQTLLVHEGVIRVAGDERGSLAYCDVARESHMRHLPDLCATTTYFASSNPGSYTVQFAEVEVDCATGLTAVTDFLAVGDVGQAINRGMVEAQFQGAVQMGIGYALCEDLAVDEHGRAGVDGFRNYHIVNAPDMPDVRVLLVEHEGDDGPFGAKSVGEIAAVPTAAAVINAVNHALGTSLADLPATPEKVLAALRCRGGDAPCR